MPLRGGAGSSPFCYRGRGSSSLRCYRWGGLIRQNEGRKERRESGKLFQASDRAIDPTSKCVAAENFPRREKAPSLLFSVRPLSVPAYLTEPFVDPSVGCCQKRIWIGNLWRKAPSFQIIFLSELFQLGIVHGGGAHARLFHTHRGRTKTVKPFSPPPVPPPPPRWTPTKQNKSGER